MADSPDDFISLELPESFQQHVKMIQHAEQNTLDICRIPEELLMSDLEEYALRWRWVQLTNTACTKEVFAEILRRRAAFRNKPRLNEVETNSPTMDTDFEVL